MEINDNDEVIDETTQEVEKENEVQTGQVPDINNIEYDYTAVDFLARFACLYEAVNIACDKAEQLGIDPDKSSMWIKPLAFQKYIKEREKDMRYQIVSLNKTGVDTLNSSEF
jgi:hypothetical protein